jgi:hypothetical protein
MEFKNLALGTVLTPPSPPTTGLSLVLNSGEGDRFSDPSTVGEYYVTAFPSGENPHLGNAEILKVTARSSDTFTIEREQRGTTAKSISADWIVIQGIYAEDVVGLTNEQTLTNKTLISPVINPIAVTCQITDSSTDAATGDGKAILNIPSNLNGYNLNAVAASVETAPVGSAISIQIHNATDAVDMLSTPLTIDAGENTSATAATPAVIDTNTDDIATNDRLRIDVDAVGSSTAGAGLVVRLEFAKP